MHVERLINWSNIDILLNPLTLPSADSFCKHVDQLRPDETYQMWMQTDTPLVLLCTDGFAKKIDKKKLIVMGFSVFTYYGVMPSPNNKHCRPCWNALGEYTGNFPLSQRILVQL